MLLPQIPPFVCARTPPFNFIYLKGNGKSRTSILRGAQVLLLANAALAFTPLPLSIDSLFGKELMLYFIRPHIDFPSHHFVAGLE